MSLQGKNVIITGATSGIGVEVAKALTSAGASVFIGGRRADKGEKVAEETKSVFHQVDVADQESNKAFFAAAEKHFGGPETVDFVLLNAGVEGKNEDTMVSSLNVDTFDYIYSVNVRGVVLGMLYGTPLLRKGGTFVLTSSAGSVLAFSANPIYASSKAAVDSLVRSYAAQFAESDDERIRSLSIVAINPTLYITELSHRFVGGDMDMADTFAKMVNVSQRVGKAEELATIVHDFVHGDLPYHSGDTFVADADQHFPISEYMNRLQDAKKQAAEATVAA